MALVRLVDSAMTLRFSIKVAYLLRAAVVQQFWRNQLLEVAVMVGLVAQEVSVLTSQQVCLLVALELRAELLKP